MIKITTPLTADIIKKLKVGDMVSLSGVIYTARDLAHKRLNELIDKGVKLPFDIKGAVIYYAGPTPAPGGKVIGSIGPTSSYRVDKLTPALLELGLKGMIGKGKRSAGIMEEIKQKKAVYFAAVGGAGAAVAKKVKSAEVVAFPEFGAEAVRQLVVEDFNLIVAYDIYGGDIFKQGKKKYSRK